MLVADVLVVDLQDIGTRFYTYMTTMAYVLEEAAGRKIKVFVLDRPNPIGGVQIEGPALDASAAGRNPEPEISIALAPESNDVTESISERRVASARSVALNVPVPASPCELSTLPPATSTRPSR